MSVKRLLICVLAIFFAMAALAQQDNGGRQGPSAQAGQQIATVGAPNGVTACTGCHGAQGEGNPSANFPRIGGQSAYYLDKQMSAFATGARDNPIMGPIAKAMSEQQRQDSSAYYASLQAPSPPATGASADAGQTARARQLATVGDETKQLQACANCHGPGGRGEAPAYPYLAGQHASYFTAAMGEWTSGQRNTDGSGQMPSIAKRLSDEEVAALAAYFAAQPVPTAAALAVNTPAGSRARPAVAATAAAGGPRGATAMPAGIGSEQGSPLTGGGQGPGGGGATQAGQAEQPVQPPPTKKK
ncbi:MAG: c-type cytochrome [Massilia sp.]